MRPSYWFFLLLIAFSVGTALPAEKPKPEEVVRRHVASLPASQIGSAGLKAEGQSFMADARGGSDLVGRVVLLSSGRKLRLSMIYGLNEYPGEDIAYDGKSLEVGWIRPGVRSDLGLFFRQFKEVISAGVFGGVLSTAWPLLNLKGRKGEVKYRGMKEMDGEKFHVLKYWPPKGGSAQIDLYFDPETFRHCYSTHTIRIGVPMVHDPNVSANQDETWYILKESFKDFHEAGSGAVPTTWIIEFTTQTGKMGSVWRWTNRFSTVETVPAIESERFTVK